MKKYGIIAAVLAVVAVLAGGAYAADFTSLQGLKVSEVKEAAAEVPAPSVPKASPAASADRNTSAITKVENPKYICQTHGGGHAVALNGNSARVWQVDGAEEGAEEGLELNNVVLTRHSRPDNLDIAGNLSFYGQTIKLALAIRTDAKDQGKPYMIVKMNGEGQEPPLEKVPCSILY